MGGEAKLIERLYESLQRGDHTAMAELYHSDATFADPVFPDLHGSEIAAMWHMLCEQGKDLEVVFADVTADEENGSASWEAEYTFGPSGRFIHNRIRASFTFSDGLIRSHVDEFDLWKWSRQAVGWSGIAVGWTKTGKAKVREFGRQSLDRFIESHPEYQRTDD